MTNFQLLMLSPNLLKSQSPIMVGRGEGWQPIPTFEVESKSAKIPNSHYGMWLCVCLWGRGGLVTSFLNFDTEFKSAKSHSLILVGVVVGQPMSSF